jgi:hypothetical protein
MKIMKTILYLITLLDYGSSICLILAKHMLLHFKYIKGLMKNELILFYL